MSYVHLRHLGAGRAPFLCAFHLNLDHKGLRDAWTTSTIHRFKCWAVRRNLGEETSREIHLSVHPILMHEIIFSLTFFPYVTLYLVTTWPTANAGVYYEMCTTRSCTVFCVLAWQCQVCKNFPIQYLLFYCVCWNATAVQPRVKHLCSLDSVYQRWYSTQQLASLFASCSSFFGLSQRPRGLDILILIWREGDRLWVVKWRLPCHKISWVSSPLHSAQDARHSLRPVPWELCFVVVVTVIVASARKEAQFIPRQSHCVPPRQALLYLSSSIFIYHGETVKYF